MRDLGLLCLTTALLSGCSDAVGPAPSTSSEPYAVSPPPAGVACNWPDQESHIEAARLPEDFAYGRWVVVQMKSDPAYPDLHLDERDPAWIGAQLDLSPSMMRLDDAPKGMRRDAVNTCAGPTFVSDIRNSASNLCPYIDVYKYFGLPPVDGRRLYKIECHGRIDRGELEVTPEETDGPSLIYPYSPDRLIVVWSPGQMLLLERKR